MPRRAIVAGAGIGGLSSALALSQAGFKVTVYERAKALEEFGAGVQLTPNATRILSRLGALESVRRLAMPPTRIRVLSGQDGAILASMDLSDADRRWGAPYLALHRADLQAALAGIVNHDPNTGLVLGAGVTGVRDEPDQVSVSINGDASASDRADLLVGADGLRSRIRRVLEPKEAAIAFTGRMAFRATIDSALLEPGWSQPEITICLGPNAHLVCYPLRSRSIVNIVAVTESQSHSAFDEVPWDGAASLGDLEFAFARWSAPIRRLLAAAGQWRAWPLFARPPLRSFHKERVALVGDAAHPMVPFLAQGAAQAIEDAGALGRALSKAKDVRSGLADYSQKRVARATRVQIEAQRQGRIYHLSGPLALARNAALQILGGSGLRARYDWLYGA